MISSPTAASFAPHLHSSFTIRQSDGASVDLELVEVTERTSPPGPVQFSLLFQGPLERFLPQQIHRMEHEQLGVLDLFMVPVARQADGFRYEAVFNLLVDA